MTAGRGGPGPRRALEGSWEPRGHHWEPWRFAIVIANGRSARRGRRGSSRRARPCQAHCITTIAAAANRLNPFIIAATFNIVTENIIIILKGR